MERVQITTNGIKKSLKRYDELSAIGEYIWNGFDAQATCVEILYSLNELGTVSELKIRDNGYGIPKKKLKEKFKPFLESEKEINPYEERLTSAVHGKNGMGRLTFFHISSTATWDTVYSENGNNYNYKITINSEDITGFEDTNAELTTKAAGTTVMFNSLNSPLILEAITEYIKYEFCWFLELNADRGFAIKINEDTLNYEDIIENKDSFNIKNEKTGTEFEIKTLQWKVNLNNEYSRYYFINSKNIEVHKQTTKFNNKGDNFYHSVYIKSIYFDDWINNHNEELKDEQGNEQLCFLNNTKKQDDYKFLISEVNKFLKNKRKPFLKKYTDTLINDLNDKQAFPIYGNNPWDKMRKNSLEKVVRELYQVEPKIFSKLNKEQKKTFVRFLDLILDAGETDRLFEILNEIVELDTDERSELAEILKVSKLSNVIKTIKLIQDRYKAINELKTLVFVEELKANERDHIQKFVESHYWIFGEQYSLATAEEPKFEEALRRYHYILTGEDKEQHIDHIDKKKEMDIFMVRQNFELKAINNVVVELKHPKVKLGEDELSQVKRYMRVINSQDEFNANNSTWDFYLVGNSFDNTGYIQGELENLKDKGEKSLVYSTKNYRIFVKTWSEIFNEFELKHKYLNDKLELERKRLLSSAKSANEVIDGIANNTATQPKEISIPNGEAVGK